MQAYALDLGPNPPHQRRVLQRDAQCTDRNQFVIVETGELMDVMCAGAGGGPLYLPVHGRCWGVVVPFVESRKDGEGEVDDGVVSSVMGTASQLHSRSQMDKR